MFSDVRALVRPRQSPRSAALGLLVLFFAGVLAVGAHDALLPHKALYRAAGGDFRAFYCAGEAVARGADPYRVEPLRSCEARVQALPNVSAGVVDPAPLPGYALALFETLARVPYPAAKVVWFATLVASVVAGAWFVAQLTGFPTLLVLLGLSLVDGYVSFLYGQLPPLVTALVAGSAYFAERGRVRTAAALAVAAMIEPHLGLAAVVSLFVWLPRARPVLALGVAALALTGIAATGWASSVDYAMRVLPAQAASELVAVDQWSLSHELHVLGADDATALRLGTLSYLLMLAVGTYVGGRAARTLASPALAVLVAPAAVLVGGSYLHELQLAVALPAAFVLVARAERGALAAGAALGLLIFPWFSLAGAHVALTLATVTPAVAACVWLACARARTRSLGARAAATGTVVAAFAALLIGLRHVPQPLAAPRTPTPASAVAPTALASANWGEYLRAQPDLSVPTPRKELEKVPSWIALAILLVLAASQRRAGASAVAAKARVAAA